MQVDRALDRMSMDDQEEPYVQDPTDPTRFSQSQVCTAPKSSALLSCSFFVVDANQSNAVS